MPKTSRHEVVQTLPERISEQSHVIEVPTTWCWGSVEVVKSVPSERMGKQSRSIEVRHAGKVSRQSKESLRSEVLSGGVVRARL